MARTTRAQVRLTSAELARIAAIAPLLPHASTAGPRCEQLLRRGLLLTEAVACASGGEPPPGLTREALATLATQELVAILPLLLTTGRRGLLELLVSAPSSAPPPPPVGDGEIDAGAADDVAGLGCDAFL